MITSRSAPGYVELTGSNVQLTDPAGETSAGRKTATQGSPGGCSTLRLNVWGVGTSAFDLQVQGQMWDGQWYTLPPSDFKTGSTLGDDITAGGIFDFDVAGMQYVAVNVVSVTGGNVNTKGAFLP